MHCHWTALSGLSVVTKEDKALGRAFPSVLVDFNVNSVYLLQLKKLYNKLRNSFHLKLE